MTAYIMARAGSKRIPGKHTRRFCNAPMIHHAIWHTAKCPDIKRIVVSTNDPDVETCVRAQDVWVEIHERSNRFATAEAPMYQAFLEAYDATDNTEEIAVMVYATAAFLRPEWLSDAIDWVASDDFDSVCAVYEDAAPVERSLSMDGFGRTTSRFPEYDNQNNTGWLPTYHHASQIFAVRPEAVREAQTFMIPGRTGGYTVPRHQVEDVDAPGDWEVAEAKMRVLAG